MVTLIFDAQVFQTPAWHRGMGKYSLELIKAVAQRNSKSKKWESIYILLSSRKEIDQILEGELMSLPCVQIEKIDLAPNDILNPSETSIYNRRTVNEFITGLKGEISFVVLSLMQGEICSTFPSIKPVHKSVLFYDLIPLMFHQTYLQNPITRKEYLSKLEELLNSDTFLAISKTVANDLSVYLGIDPSRIISIDGGPIAHDVKTEELEVSHPFILMPTGNDLRKNNRKGIEGFNIFNKKHSNQYTLVVTSYFEDWQIEELSQLSDKVIFTGNISGAKLNYLYKNAASLLFPSLYEGLGLPVLEALENDLSVACSDITVFREISPSAFVFFDPQKIRSIAEGIEHAIRNGVDKQVSEEILRKYSWDNTAEIAESILTVRQVLRSNKTDISIFTPDLSGDNKVGKMILQAHASFNRLFATTYYEAVASNRPERRINFLPYITKTQQIRFNSPIPVADNQNAVIYHITNQREVAPIAFRALVVPGIVILHDLDLRLIWSELKEKRMISVERYDLEEQINTSFGDVATSYGIGTIIAHQRLVVVFSSRAKKILESMIKKMNKATRVIQLDLPVNNLVYSDIISDREKVKVTNTDISNTDDREYEAIISHAEIIASSESISTDVLLPYVEAKKYESNVSPSYEVYASKIASLVDEVKEFQS